MTEEENGQEGCGMMLSSEHGMAAALKLTAAGVIHTGWN